MQTQYPEEWDGFFTEHERPDREYTFCKRCHGPCDHGVDYCLSCQTLTPMETPLIEIDLIQIQYDRAVAWYQGNEVAVQMLTGKNAAEQLLKRLHQLGYTSKQIGPSPDGSKLLIWI